MKRNLIRAFLMIILCFCLLSPVMAAETEEMTSEELFAGYVEQVFYGDEDLNLFSVGSDSAGARLTGNSKKYYDALVPIMKQIASGSRANTIVTIGTAPGVDGVITGVTDPFTNFNADVAPLLHALLADLPYELYWYEKTMNTNMGCSGNNTSWTLTIQFPVIQAYRKNSDPYTVDTAKTGAPALAAANANAIVAANASKNDYEKLVAYKEAICDLVSYNDPAASPSYTGGYGDPWQMIWVFDGDPGTEVVCEGYSKAFQYLCDKTSFSNSNIACYSVTGFMNGGGHMWNIVTMDDGENYLVDVTNSDSGTVGQSGGLFLVGAATETGTLTGTIGGVGHTWTVPQYRYQIGSQLVTYHINPETMDLWKTGPVDDADIWPSMGILKLATSKYVYTPSTCAHTYGWESSETQHWQACTACGHTTAKEAHTNQLKKDAAYHWNHCTVCEKDNSKTAHAAALTEVKKVSAKCEETGVKAHYRCSCGNLYSDSTATTGVTEAELVISALGHATYNYLHDETEHWQICGRSGCDYTVRGVHAFTRTDSKVYVAQKADCQNRTKYYKLCVCGRVSKTETFSDPTEGLGDHDYSVLVYTATRHFVGCSVCGTKNNSTIMPHQGAPCAVCSYSPQGASVLVGDYTRRSGVIHVEFRASQMTGKTLVFGAASYDENNQMIDIAFSHKITGMKDFIPLDTNDSKNTVPIIGLDTTGASKIVIFPMDGKTYVAFGKKYSKPIN